MVLIMCFMSSFSASCISDCSVTGLVHRCQVYLICSSGARFLGKSANPVCNLPVPLLQYVALVACLLNTAMISLVVRVEISCQMAGVDILPGLCLGGDSFLFVSGDISCHGCIHDR